METRLFVCDGDVGGLIRGLFVFPCHHTPVKPPRILLKRAHTFRHFPPPSARLTGASSAPRLSAAEKFFGLPHAGAVTQQRCADHAEGPGQRARRFSSGSVRASGVNWHVVEYRSIVDDPCRQVKLSGSSDRGELIRGTGALTII